MAAQWIRILILDFPKVVTLCFGGIKIFWTVIPSENTIYTIGWQYRWRNVNTRVQTHARTHTHTSLKRRSFTQQYLSFIMYNTLVFSVLFCSMPYGWQPLKLILALIQFKKHCSVVLHPSKRVLIFLTVWNDVMSEIWGFICFRSLAYLILGGVRVQCHSSPKRKLYFSVNVLFPKEEIISVENGGQNQMNGSVLKSRGFPGLCKPRPGAGPWPYCWTDYSLACLISPLQFLPPLLPSSLFPKLQPPSPRSSIT